MQLTALRRTGPITCHVIDTARAMRDFRVASAARCGLHTRSLQCPSSLPSLLVFDAVTCAVMGALLVLGSGTLSGLTLLPTALLTEAGIVLLAVAAFILFVATRRVMPALGVIAIIAGNAFWVLGSLAVLLATTPNALGTGFVLVQAFAVAALAALELTEWRAAAPSPRMG
jgi:hypothetical protein